MVTRSKKRKQKHLFYDREWMIFPFAIGWNKELYYTQEPTARITFHFLWWHWKWDFKKKQRRKNR